MGGPRAAIACREGIFQGMATYFAMPFCGQLEKKINASIIK